MRKFWIFLSLAIALSIGCNGQPEPSAESQLPFSVDMLGDGEQVALAESGSEVEVDEPDQPVTVDTAEPTRIEIESKVHNFGCIDTYDPCKHRFFIKNVGTAPLYLERGRTSCTCTMSTVPAKPIPPGMGAAIDVTSKIDDKKGPFSHTANIYTNDPEHKVLTLKITGDIQTILNSYPDNVVFSSRQFQEESTTHVLVYSQTWENFEVEKVEASDDTITWQIEPATEEALQAIDAKSGYKFNLTAAADIPPGPFFKKLNVTTRRVIPVSQESSIDSPEVQAASCTIKEEVRQLAIIVNGEVPSRFSLTGRNLFTGDRVKLGIREWGATYTETLMFKVHDEHRMINATNIEVTPDFLELSFKRVGREDLGLYRIDVTIPADAPTGDYWHANEKNIRISIDHPHIKQIDFFADFTIIP